MPTEILFWLLIFVALAVTELATMQLVSIWFAAGALGALVMSAVGFSLWVQAIVFVVISAILLIFTRPILQKLLHKTPIPTNSELDIGKSALVVENIDNIKLTGRVNLNGVDWTARSSSNEVIREGETVVVDKIDGSKVFVSVE